MKLAVAKLGCPAKSNPILLMPNKMCNERFRDMALKVPKVGVKILWFRKENWSEFPSSHLDLILFLLRAVIGRKFISHLFKSNRNWTWGKSKIPRSSTITKLLPVLQICWKKWKVLLRLAGWNISQQTSFSVSNISIEASVIYICLVGTG